MTRADLSKRAFMDTALIALMLIGANWLLSRGDMGWTKLSPSPYLLLPILIGGRFGFVPGIAAGVVASLIVLLLRGALNVELLRTALDDDRYLLLSFPVIGATCGEIAHHFQRKSRQLSVLNESLRERVRKIDTDNRFLRHAKDELERSIATRDSGISTLDTEIRRLYSASSEDLPQSILYLVNRQTRAFDAAIYLAAGTEGQLRRIACIGSNKFLPATLCLMELDMARLAWNRQTLVTLPEVLKGTLPDNTNHLIAVPMLDSAGKPFGMLLVSGMPFTALNPRTADLLGIITKWAGEILDLNLHAGGKYRLVAGSENLRIYSRDFFNHILQLSIDSYHEHNIPSSLLIFTLIEDSHIDQSKFELVLLQMLRAGDYAAEVEISQPHLAVLLPLTGERGAAICQDRIFQHWQEELPNTPLPRVERVLLSSLAEVDRVLQKYNLSPVEV